MPDRRGLAVLYCAATRQARSDPGNQPINLFSALLALATGVLYASLAPLLAMGDMRPNLILAAVVAVTALFGLGAGATWAFVGGLTANLLTTDPLGLVPLGLLLVAGLVALLGRPLGRRPVVLAFVGGLAGSAALDLADGLILALQGGSAPGTGIAGMTLLVLPTAMANGILAAAIFLAVRAAAGRIGSEMPAAWG
ncbi:MAG TPA: hypothetical protein VJ839_04870 [Candidatus Limnocylindria bacterium]|nr:hypothetical protein [Candidatus Limnocylindria bacterium]